MRKFQQRERWKTKHICELSKSVAYFAQAAATTTDGP
jgi:hypothetical protein